MPQNELQVLTERGIDGQLDRRCRLRWVLIGRLWNGEKKGSETTSDIAGRSGQQKERRGGLLAKTTQGRDEMMDI
jgi:hypothetical protein